MGSALNSDHISERLLISAEINSRVSECIGSYEKELKQMRAIINDLSFEVSNLKKDVMELTCAFEEKNVAKQDTTNIE